MCTIGNTSQYSHGPSAGAISALLWASQRYMFTTIVLAITSTVKWLLYIHIHAEPIPGTTLPLSLNACTHIAGPTWLTDEVSYIYYSGSHKMKGTACALLWVVTHHRLVTGHDTHNKDVMLITGAITLGAWPVTLVSRSYMHKNGGKAFGQHAVEASWTQRGWKVGQAPGQGTVETS